MTILERYKPLWAPDGASGGSSAPAGGSGGGGGSASSAPSAPSSAPSSPSGGSPSPAESPASAGEAQPNDTFSGEFSFDSIFNDGDEGSPPPSGGEAPTGAPPSVPPQPVQPPAAAAPVAEAKPDTAAAQPAAAPVEAAPGASPPPQPPAALDPFNPGQLAQHLLSVEAEATNFVASQMFALTPEDREAIETDVVAHIPKLLARVFVKSQQNVLQQLDRLIPTMVQRHTDAMRRNMEGENRFYAKWPNIGREHASIVNQLAVAYRQMHPNATLDQMIEEIGPFVMMQARIAPSTAGVPVAGQPAMRPAANGAAGGRPPQPAPFVPAGSGSGPATQTKAQELSPWEAMFVNRD